MAGEPSEGPRYSSPEERQQAERRRRRLTTVGYAIAAVVASAALTALWWNLQVDDERRVDGLAHTNISSCTVVDDGLAVAEVSVTNGSDEYSNYIVEVAFVDGDGDEIDVRNANLHGVRSGDTVVEEVRSRETVVGDVDCEVRSAFRFFAGAAPRD